MKLWIKTGLYLYYGSIKIDGLENVPKNEAVLFLPNHQGALMDVLLIVTDCNRKPFFLTRSDVFRGPTLNKIFAFLQMLPIYRIRDGRESLKKNQAVFDTCFRLFQENRALVMFPEANHNLKRRVRPLSKGFTRIVFNTLKKIPESEIHIIPVGMNYRSNTGFPDKVAVYYGSPISAREMDVKTGRQKKADILKNAVSDSLKILTTHIEDEGSYDATIQKLNAQGVNYLDPTQVNTSIKKESTANTEKRRFLIKNHGSAIFKGIFTALNAPIIALWRIWIKPKVWEPEFMGTMRFGFALVIYPFYYLMLFILIVTIWNVFVGLAVIVGLFLFNWGYVRWN